MLRLLVLGHFLSALSNFYFKCEHKFMIYDVFVNKIVDVSKEILRCKNNIMCKGKRILIVSLFILLFCWTRF
jgi:hypothetical protein